MRALMVVVVVMLVGGGMWGQAVPLQEAQVRGQLVKLVNPVYPPIARAARVAGTVVLEVEIGRDGRVKRISAEKGPEMLRAAAIDAVKQWEFKPFVEGEVKTEIAVPFVLPGPVSADDSKINQAFGPLSQRCHALVGANADVSEQAKVCREAADVADQFARDDRFIDRRSAYVYCATALLRAGDAKAALSCADKAVAVVLQGHDDASGTGAAYTVRAQAEMKAGEMSAADQDLTAAVKSQRDALKWSEAEAPDLSKSYRFALKMMLNLHAQVYQAIGRSAEAEAAAREASTM